MPGILDYKQYNELFATVKDVIEHFPSEQFTLPYDFNNLGSNGYTATISYQSFIVDQISYSTPRTPNFSNTKVLGYFPKVTLAQPLGGAVQLPKDMYVYPMYPERLTDVPITVIDYTFYKNTEIFSRQLLLIENWEPGMEIGDPKDHPDYEPIIETGYRFTATLTLSPNPVIPTSTVNIQSTVTSIGQPSTSTVFFNNTASITVRALGTDTGETQLLTIGNLNYQQGALATSTVITQSFVPTRLFNNYTVNTGTFSNNNFNFTATLFKNYEFDLRWRRLQLSDTEMILGGRKKQTLTVNSTTTTSTELRPIVLQNRDQFTNSITPTVFSFSTSTLEASVTLPFNYQAQVSDVEFTAQYSPDYQIQNYTLLTSPLVTDIINVQVAIPPKLTNTELLTSEITAGVTTTNSLIGQSFQFPQTANNLNSGTFTVTSVTPVVVWPNFTQLKLGLSRNWTTHPYNSVFSPTTVPVSVPVPNVQFQVPGFSAVVLTRKLEYIISRQSSRILSVRTLQEYPNNIYAPQGTRVYKTYIQSDQLIQGGTLRQQIRYEYFELSQPSLTTATTAWSYYPDRQFIIGNYKQGKYQVDLGSYTEWPTLQTRSVAPLSDLYGPLIGACNSFEDYGISANNGEIGNSFKDKLVVYSLNRPIEVGSKLTFRDREYQVVGNMYTTIPNTTNGNNQTWNKKNQVILDPPWYNHTPSSYGDATIYNTTVDMAQEQNYYSTWLVSPITQLVYPQGLGVPYYDSTATFNKITISPSAGQQGGWLFLNSEFNLAGTTTSPKDTKFRVTAYDGLTLTFEPAYTISHPVNKPQWQKDNDTYNHFMTYEANRPIMFRKSTFQTNTGKIIGCYDENRLYFESIPADLKIGASFNALASVNNQGVYLTGTVSAIDPFRNILTINKTSQNSSYLFINQFVTFINPASTGTSTVFLGTATSLDLGQVNDDFEKTHTWKLNRQYTQGTYIITATVKKSVVTGTNVSIYYPKNNTSTLAVTSSDGLNAGLFMVVDQTGPTLDWVEVISNILNARNPNNFYVYNNAVSFYVNGNLYQTGTWQRQGTTYIQKVRVPFPKGVINNTLYAYWPGSLNFNRTSSDQILFIPDTIGLPLPSTSTTVVSAGQVGSEVQFNAQVRVLDSKNYNGDDYIPDGLVNWRIREYTKNYLSTGTSYSEISFYAPNYGTGTLINGQTETERIYDLGYLGLNESTYNGHSKYFRIQGDYQGDAYRSTSTGLSSIFRVKPVYSEYTITQPDQYSRNFDINLFKQKPNVGYIPFKEVYLKFNLDYWVEPVDQWTTPSSYELTALNIELRARDILSGPSYSYYPYYQGAEYPIPYPPVGTPPLPPGSKWQSETLTYQTSTQYTNGVPLLKRSLFVKQRWNFNSPQVINELQETNWKIRVTTPANWQGRQFLVRYNLRNFYWSAIDF